MKNKKVLLIFSLILCILFAMSSVNAGIFEFADDTGDVDNGEIDARDSDIDLDTNDKSAKNVDVEVSNDDEKEDFGFFKLQVPNNVNLQPVDYNNSDGYISILYINNNSETFNDVIGMDAWFLEPGKDFLEIGPDYKLIKTEGDLKIYKDKTTDEDIYWVIKDFGVSSSFGIMGQDLKTLKNMINSLEVIGIDMYQGYGHFGENDELILDSTPSYVGSYN